MNLSTLNGLTTNRDPANETYYYIDEAKQKIIGDVKFNPNKNKNKS